MADVTISNGLIEAVVHLPDAERGFYRSTRFDWSGMIGRLTVGGRTVVEPWFSRRDEGVRDFIYRGDEVVVGDESAAVGLAEEFPTPQGYAAAKPGDTFVKIGVGALRKAGDQPYSPFTSYDIVDTGVWTSIASADAVTFEQRFTDSASGYSYDYRKRLRLEPGRAAWVIEHALTNTGRQPIEATQYNHNFFTFDGVPTATGMSIVLPFAPRVIAAPDATRVAVDGHHISYRRALVDQECVAFAIEGFSDRVTDHDLRIEHPAVGTIRISADRPLVRLYLWSIRSVMSIEPFVDVATAPGACTTWARTYEFEGPTA